MNEKSLFEQLQTILLQEERKSRLEINKKVQDIKEEVTDLKDEVEVIKEDVSGLKEDYQNDEKFGSKVEPIFNNKIKDLKVNFQQYFGHEVKETIKAEIKYSRDEFIETLYPIIGQIVRRYVKYQFDGFLQNVSDKMEKAFSPGWYWKRMKAFFAGVSSEELLVKESMNIRIEEAFVIHLESGLLIGCYSSNNTTDVDLIAGMLTAIKAFVQDAFREKEYGELETIEYGKYRILINHFHKYYIASVLTGVFDSHFKQNLDKHLMHFSGKHVPDSIKDVDDRLFESVSKRLKVSIQEFESEYNI